MDFEGRVWPLAGGFGRYTRLLAAASWLPNVFVSLGFHSNTLYTRRAPGCPCRNASHTEPAVEKNGSCPGDGGGPGAAWLQSDMVTQWDLVCDDEWKVPLEQICYLIGWLLGYIIYGWVCDRFGRRHAFNTALVVALPLGVASSLAPGYFSFLPIQAGFGAALAGLFLSLYIARLELCPPGRRLMITMIGGFFWLAGQLLLPGLAALCSDWKILQGAITGTLALLLGYWCFRMLFPESPRWLLATQQVNRLKAELFLFSRANGVDTGEDLPGQDSLFTEIDSFWEVFPHPRYYSICSIFGTRLIWRNALILGFTTFIGCGIRPCFARNLMVLGGSVPYFLQAGGEALACIFLCITVSRWGRRAVLLLCTILTGLCSLLLLALTQYLFSAASIAISLLGSLCAHAVVMLSIFYASEVLPTVIRLHFLKDIHGLNDTSQNPNIYLSPGSPPVQQPLLHPSRCPDLETKIRGSGLGVILGVSMLGRASLPIIILQHKSGYFLHHVVLSSFCVLSVLSILLLPETKRKNLPDTLKQGDSLRRPPLLLQSAQDALPLLSADKPRVDYDLESYARLASSTKKMIKTGCEIREDNKALNDQNLDQV